MMKNILVPVDGSEGADRAIEKAVMLAKLCNAKVNFLYVANINQLAINAESNNIDLIVMGSRGLGVVKGVLLGSVSQYVVEQAKCPVLVVK